jgi:hypothetical protein
VLKIQIWSFTAYEPSVREEQRPILPNPNSVPYESKLIETQFYWTLYLPCNLAVNTAPHTPCCAAAMTCQRLGNKGQAQPQRTACCCLTCCQRLNVQDAKPCAGDLLQLMSAPAAEVVPLIAMLTKSGATQGLTSHVA